MAKSLSAIIILLILWIQYHVWYGAKSKNTLLALSQDISEQQRFNDELVKQNNELKTEVLLLRNNPKILEEKAREQLGLIKKGEIFYRVIPSEK